MSGRKSLPHLPAREEANRSVIQYLTVCVKNRRKLLDQVDVAAVLIDSWKSANHWLVGRYVIMPDHLHLFCAPAVQPVAPLANWVRFWKSASTRNWPKGDAKPIWQKDFFDRQLRHGESYGQKWRYLVENPVKAGLVKNWEEWPYQGELNELQWHEPADSKREG